jgi:proteasome lid subunit RPN8/RPN11
MATKFETWSAPGHSFRIEYSAVALDEIRQEAVDGYHRVPHGGVETGGILFGTHEEAVVRIQAWRPIVCEYAKGPSFALSEKEEAALAEALKSWGGDAALADLEPVGWYRAHTRSEVLLSDADLAFFNRFFPQPWQAGLIVRPTSFAPTRAGFFFREVDGGIRAESSYHEFTLMPVAMEQAATEQAAEQAPAISAEAPGVALPNAARAAEPRPVWASAPQPPLRGSGAARKWYAAGLGVLVIAVLGFWLLRPSAQGLNLSATDIGGQLRIAWDGAARPISRAQSGWIEIDDHGVRTQVKLTPADLRSGNVFYARQSGDVAVRLIVDAPGSAPVAETTRFLRPGESGPAPAPASAPRLDAGEKREPPRQPAVAQTSVGAPPVSVLPPAPATPARRLVAFRAPDAAVPQPSTDLPAIAPPKIENLPAAPPAGLTSVLGQAPAPGPLPPHRHVRQPPRQPPRVGSSGPASSRRTAA